ncbi:MAG TPA: amino acid adenylation domain-containing protein, partial [Ktedonobacteraceae bacterium]|nr:amino acid adenylation domain-containing protein [Ktedonobacteraceae bacterium]
MSRHTNIEDIYPLSPIQEGILFHTLFASSPSMYTSQLRFTVIGSLDVAILRKVWEDILTRHSILRTAIIYEHGQRPVQIVQYQVALPFTELDWRALPGEEQSLHLERFLQEDYERGFVLSKPPLLRLTVIQLAEDTFSVIWTSHHIIMDGWSRSLLLKEIFERYQLFSQGQFLPAKSGRPYRDYIDWWQRKSVQSEPFWRELLKGKITPTSLDPGVFHKQAPNDGEQRVVLQGEISTEVWNQLRSLARQFHITASTLLEGAFALLLSYYSDEQDILFGVTVSGRPVELTGAEYMAGIFLNTLPIRLQISAQTRLSEWLHQIFLLQQEMLQYQHNSLVEIQRWSEIPHDCPLFESIFVFANFPTDVAQMQALPNIAIQDIHFREQNNYPLCLSAMPGTTLRLTIDYDPHVIASHAATHLLEHYQLILEKMVTHPYLRLWEYSPISVAERQMILVDWNATQREFPGQRSFQEQFEEQVIRTPDAIAVSDAQGQCTYEQINLRANAYAHYLRYQRIYPEQIVALLGQRDSSFLIALLGILKSGGTYLPLDPRYPPKRLARLLSQSKARLVLVADELLPAFKETLQHLTNGQQPHYLILNSPELETMPVTNLPSVSSPQNLVYLIYTSGSTGLPKGVMIEQRGMLNHLAAKIDDLHIGPGDCLAQNASQSFDVSIWQFFAPLLVGGRVHIVVDAIVQEPLTMLKEAAEQGITIIETVPSWLRMLFEYTDLAFPTLPDLRLLFVMGEILPPRLCRQWMEAYPAISLMNAYGPTECSDDVTHYLISAPPEASALLVPIGWPLANMHLYVLNTWLQPVPIGLAGELYIGGGGVGRGYHDDPARTAEAFIPHPFSLAKGERLYKTGDTVRWREDGSLEFLRRVDDQVKLRGLRVELGEIENALFQHPLIREAALKIREEIPGDQRLVAYVVLRTPNASEFEAQELQSLNTEYVKNWQYIFDEHYNQRQASPIDPAIHSSIWMSSY